ncbi:MAG: hypothetical protein KC621_32825 [Myxococcales bacterium]|nr:hypothetical protein [Myxococcales bacterium]
MNHRVVLLSLLLASPLAHAGARKLPTWDVSSEEAALKSSKTWKMTTKGKPKAYPKTVAIPFFEVRYSFKETTTQRSAGQGVTGTTATTLRFSDADYEQLTNELYAELVARLEAEGFEVRSRADVVASSAYGELVADDQERENGKRLVYSPSGMKNLPVFSGQPRNPGGLAAVASELGVDAVVGAFVNVGICSVEPTKKTDMRSGVYACIKGDLTMPGFNLTFLGAPEPGKKKASWTARLFKQTEMYTYNKGDKTVYDMAMVANWSSAQPLKRNFWGNRKLAADQESYVGGTTQIYRDLLTMAFARWEDKFGRSREAAGLQRHALGEAEPEGDVPPPEPEVYPVPPLPGTTSCFVGTSTQGPMVLRRGLDADGGRIVEDLLLELDGQPPYRAVSLWEVDGASADLSDRGGAWTGTASLQGDPWAWTGWTTDLTMTASGATVAAHYDLSGGRYTGTSEVTMNGAVVATTTVELDPAEASVCEEHLSVAAPPDGAF